MNYNYNNLSGSVILRADSHSQKTIVADGDSLKELITDEHFWGTSNKKGLYYEFDSEDNNEGYAIASEGWNDYTDRSTEKMNSSQTFEWVQNKILSNQEKNICVIQGYAGCGKTTFVNDILRRSSNVKMYSDYYNFYIGYVNDSNENKYITTSIKKGITEQIITTLKTENGMKIYDQFIELLKKNSSSINRNLVDYISIFTSTTDTSIYNWALNIHKKRKSKKIDKYEDDFIDQFDNAHIAKMMQFKYNSFYSSEKNSYNEGLDILLTIDILWKSAVYLSKNNNSELNQIIVYDNLDIIDNQMIVADFIDTLRKVLKNYSDFRRSIKLPYFKILIAVRKITYSSISHFTEVGMNETAQIADNIHFLDISCLYPSNKVLKHKSSILIEHIDEFVPKGAICREQVVKYLSEIIKIPDEIFTEIKFSELLNHNLRACANMMEKVISSSFYNNFLATDSKFSKFKFMDNKCKAGIWINIICSILKEEGIFSSLGYCTSSSRISVNVTTLSRLILTYLTNQRNGMAKGDIDYPTTDVSFIELVQSLSRLPIISNYAKLCWPEGVDTLIDEYDESNTQENIIHYITKMLHRNDTSTGIELWRRPIYYTKNTFSLENDADVKKLLHEQIKNDTNNSPSTHFCITDEGSTFIEKFATHFEFYSIRYNNRESEPLPCVSEAERINRLIKRVFNQIEECCKKQRLILDFYEKKYDVKLDDFLKEKFHPRTADFTSQLHVVRTIYDHISYFNEIRDYYKNTESSGKIPQELNVCFLYWIGKYLQLYKIYFYEIFINTKAIFFNDVWLDLKYLYVEIINEIETKNQFDIYLLSINRKYVYEKKNNNQDKNIWKNELERNDRIFSDEIMKCFQ